MLPLGDHSDEQCDWIRQDGQTGFVLLVSCGGWNGGGLWCLDGRTVERLDRLNSAGIMLHEGFLVRLLHSGSAPDFGAEVLFCDAHGISKYFRVDGAEDAHYLDWDGTNYVIAAPWHNRVVWVSAAGQVVRTWEAQAEVDAWHLNGVCCHDNRVLVTAFGEFRHHRGWHPFRTAGTGFFLDLTTGEKVLSNLDCPHTPRFLDGHWVLCNASLHQVAQYDPATQRTARTVSLQGWTRGLAFSDDYLFVGESSVRGLSIAEGGHASVAVLDRRSWEVVERVPLPCEEIGDLLVVPKELAEGVRRGFRTNPARAKEQDQYFLFDQLGIAPTRLWATSDPLAPADCQIEMGADPPAEMIAGTAVELLCKVKNLGKAILASCPPNPVHLSYRWFIRKGDAMVMAEEGMRTSLSRSLLPRSADRYRVLLRAPQRSGEYVLRLTLVQEGVRWFDEFDDRFSVSAPVTVSAPKEADGLA